MNTTQQQPESHYPIIEGKLDNLKRDNRYRITEYADDQYHTYFCDEYISAHKTLISAVNACHTLRTKHKIDMGIN